MTLNFKLRRHISHDLCATEAFVSILDENGIVNVSHPANLNVSNGD